MNHWRSSKPVLVLGTLAAVLTGCQNASTSDSSGLSDAERYAFSQNEIVISRVTFKDAATARKIAISFEPIEISYDDGYLLTDLERENFVALRDLEPSLGITVSVDNALTTQQTNLLKRIETQGLPAVRTQSISGYACYRTVEETYTTAQNIVTNYPNLAAWSDIGDSWLKTQNRGGYDLRVLKLTNKNITGTKPKAFIMAAIHAREYTTAETATRLAEYLVTNYGSNADVTWMLDHQEVHFLFQANPDGRKQAEAGVLWRKNNNTNYCRTGSTKGADLNRNSSFEWNTGGSSSNTCSETYRGPSAASEPETQTIQNYASSIFPDQRGPNTSDPAPATTSGIFITLHSYSELVLWPWGNRSTTAPNGTALQTLGRKFAFYNNYTPQQSIGLYPTSGTTDDYVYGTLGIASYTFELGTSFFQGCSTFTNTILPNNQNALLYAIRVARAPYQLPAGPEALSVAISGSTLSATLNDARFNNSNGTEPTQTVAAAEYYVDTPPWASGATPIAMTASDGSFNASSEGARATVNTAGLSSGRHTIFVRGRDSSGNWGPVGAVFLNVP
jgi:carboxypeptidase T